MNKIVCALVGVAIIATSSTTNATARTRVSTPSAIACGNWASDYARRLSREGELLGGTALGSLAGFGIGSIFAASGIGAAIGAGVGLVGGIIVREQRIERLYGAAYYDCMTGRAVVQPAMMRPY